MLALEAFNKKKKGSKKNQYGGMVNRILRVLDTNRDGFIDLNDYKHVFQFNFVDSHANIVKKREECENPNLEKLAIKV